MSENYNPRPFKWSHILKMQAKPLCVWPTASRASKYLMNERIAVDPLFQLTEE